MAVNYDQAGLTYDQAGVIYDPASFASNPSAEFWSVDSQSLQTYAFNIVSWGGSRQSPPPLRGEDTLIPHRNGKKWNPRVPDSKVITLGMWVIGANQDGTSLSDRRLFEKNWRMLRRLLWTYDRQIQLTKRFYDDADVLQYATALASFAGGLEPEMQGRFRASFVVDLLLSNPFFYSLAKTYTLAVGVKQNLPVLGDVESTKVRVELVGPLTSPTVSFGLKSPQAGFNYSGTIASGETVVVDVDGFNAHKYGPSGSSKALGLINNLGGSYYWLPLGPTPAPALLTATAGAGTAIITVNPAWH